MTSKRKAPRTRDWLLVRLLEGATKAAVHVDRRKKASRLACRKAKGRPTWDC